VDFTLADPIARALLYEGYRLYPYRTSSLKNCRPCAFGSLYPRAYSQANGGIEPWSMQIECLARGDDAASVHGAVRFLCARDQDVSEQEIALAEFGLRSLADQPARIAFSCPGGKPNRTEGTVELSSERLALNLFKVRIRIENETPLECADYAMFSTHAILGVCGGRFLSVIDPPAEAQDFAAACQNRGAWPVLVGDRARENLMLAAPIILYDYPEIAPESHGDFFDGTEIDEMLTLRILTLSDTEKEAMRRDDQMRMLLERTQSLANDQILALHGTCRLPRPAGPMKPGDRVLVRPQGRADVLDLALDGKSASILSVEQDFEGRVFYTLALDDDPGQDLGIEGKPGHRFFFRRDELELIQKEP
jgi:hypothetical protein